MPLSRSEHLISNNSVIEKPTKGQIPILKLIDSRSWSSGPKARIKFRIRYKEQKLLRKQEVLVIPLKRGKEKGTTGINFQWNQ